MSVGKDRLEAGDVLNENDTSNQQTGVSQGRESNSRIDTKSLS